MQRKGKADTSGPPGSDPAKIAAALDGPRPATRFAADAEAGFAGHPPTSHALPRVLLHGFAGTRAAWAPTLEALAADGAGAAAAGAHGPVDATAPTTCLPLPGHEAPLPPAPRFFAHVVDELVRQLGPEPVHLIGYSMGARLALGMALAAPGRVRLLTLVGVNPGLTRPQDRQTRLQADQAWQRKLRAGDMVAFVQAWQAQPLFASQAHLPPERLLAQQQARYHLRPQALADALGCLGLAAMPNYWPQLQRIQVPCAVVTGALDDKFCRLAQKMLPLLPHGFGHVVPQVGHNVPLEAPAALAKIVRAHEARSGR